MRYDEIDKFNDLLVYASWRQDINPDQFGEFEICFRPQQQFDYILFEMQRETIDFSIQTEEVYPADGGDLIDYAADEQDEDARLELTTQIENLDDYDTIFVGFPNWWGDMPMPLYTFFDEYDFSGKTIIPFNSHNGSRFSGTIDTIAELEPDAEVIEDGFTINERDVPDAAEDIASWLDELGF